ncbi:MAG: bifunctional aspartate kinase/homoserine dehydrogenase I [Ignavibacteriales bacterium]|nr:bifunctional aspartate kinase/homoserine dehydrogenase I [Ignavibacteriales bacterium]
MKVLKFGGSSVGKPKVIRQTAEIIRNSTDVRAVVLSAYQGITDKLIKMATFAGNRDRSYEDVFNQIAEIHYSYLDELISDFGSPVYKLTKVNIHELLQEMKEIAYGIYLIKELSLKSLDYIMSYGERLSCTTVSAYLEFIGVKCSYLDARKIIKTTADFNSAAVLRDETLRAMQGYFASHPEMQIVTGFIGSTLNSETTTLGRGGSDYTVSILGVALDMESIEIWTDVDGVLTADPRSVPNAFVVDALSYEEAMELSYFGAKVIYAPTIQPAYERKIPIHILNTFNPTAKGSLISVQSSDARYGITGLASIDDIVVLRVEGSGMVGVHGIVSRLFDALSKKSIGITLITQASSGHTICIAVKKNFALPAKKAIEKEFELEIEGKRLNPVHLDLDLASISVIGENMRHKAGVSGKIFGALGKYHINIVAIAQGSSELNVSLIIEQKDLVKALNVIHDEFFFNYRKKAHMYVIGASGNVGHHLIKIINNFHQDDVDFTISGISNSRTMMVDYQGVNPSATEMSRPANIDEFIRMAADDKHPLKILVDCSASEAVTEKYPAILEGGLNLVVANKIANTLDMNFYRLLRENAKEANVKFKYETNVGAALPVIKTLQQFIKSKDDVIKIEAVLSGSVNYILGLVYNGMKFKDAVDEAKKLGYTEPNPNVDLSGLDVARKILILVRELGMDMELGQLEIKSLIKGDPRTTDLNNCKLHDIDSMVAKAKTAGKKLKLIASYDKGKASVKLEELEPSHPLFSIDGANNAIRFFTKRYSTYPLVISGQGAGGELTASGILEDILSIIN